MFGGLTGRIFLFGGTKGGLSAEGKNPSRLGVLGSVVSSPTGSGAEQLSPGNRRDFEHFKPKWSTFWDPVFLNN